MQERLRTRGAPRLAGRVAPEDCSAGLVPACGGAANEGDTQRRGEAITLARVGRKGSRIAQQSTPEPAQTAPVQVGARAPKGLIGQRLVESGALDPGDLTRALALQTREDAPLGEILLAHRMIDAEALLTSLAAQWRTELIDLERTPPDPSLVDRLGAARCLALGVAPVARAGSATLVATAHPDLFERRRAEIEAALGPVIPGLAPEAAIAAAIVRVRGPHLARQAEQMRPAALSCRTFRTQSAERLTIAAVVLLACCALLFPFATLWALTAFVMATLLATAVLRSAVLGLQLRRPRPDRRPGLPDYPPTMPRRLPVVTIFVPLFHEADVAGSLVRHLKRLRYPRELMDVILLVEEGDTTTRDALARTHLPGFIRAFTVPEGGVRTKPRALNYGLALARGRIVGIWDAEDVPDPDQLHAVVSAFARADPSVACLQGRLDFFNARSNWMARCFALEYATWFRMVLPGLEGLDMPVPLGGTTLFLRRDALEQMGGWDAHNVTEDADLGIRLYRAGYRTRMVDTVTLEEANCRLRPWIRQRSRWLKGYAITWAVHMRHPLRTLREMGAWGFFGFQVLFVGTLAQFVLAPLLLSFWLLALGLPHPLTDRVPEALGWAFLAVVLVTEAVSVALTILANREPGRRGLLWWLPLHHIYFPLATLAAYKALWELMTRPFFWDKTSHGHYHHPDPAPLPQGAGRKTEPLVLGTRDTPRVRRKTTAAGPRTGVQ